MQRNSSTYCDEPEDRADYEAWLGAFDLGAKTGDIDAIVKSNAFMAELQARIVPLIVQYDAFWTRYFYQCASLLAPPCSILQHICIGMPIIGMMPCKSVPLSLDCSGKCDSALSCCNTAHQLILSTKGFISAVLLTMHAPTFCPRLEQSIEHLGGGACGYFTCDNLAPAQAAQAAAEARSAPARGQHGQHGHA